MQINKRRDASDLEQIGRRHISGVTFVPLNKNVVPDILGENYHQEFNSTNQHKMKNKINANHMTNQADPLKLPTDPHDNLSKRTDNADQISLTTTNDTRKSSKTNPVDP